MKDPDTERETLSLGAAVARMKSELDQVEKLYAEGKGNRAQVLSAFEEVQETEGRLLVIVSALPREVPLAKPDVPSRVPLAQPGDHSDERNPIDVPDPVIGTGDTDASGAYTGEF